ADAIVEVTALNTAPSTIIAPSTIARIAITRPAGDGPRGGAADACGTGGTGAAGGAGGGVRGVVIDSFLSVWVLPAGCRRAVRGVRSRRARAGCRIRRARGRASGTPPSRASRRFPR